MESTCLEINKKPECRTRRNQFLSILHGVLENGAYELAMSWSLDGTSFILKNQSLISEEILSKQFFQMKFSSFIRQLNYYGFKRISFRSIEKVFAHEYFQRGKKEWLKNIKRNHRIISDEDLSKQETPLISTDKYIFRVLQQKIVVLQAEIEKNHAEKRVFQSVIKSLTTQYDHSIYNAQSRASYQERYRQSARTFLHSFETQRNTAFSHLFQSDMSPYLQLQSDLKHIYQQINEENLWNSSIVISEEQQTNPLAQWESNTPFRSSEDQRDSEDHVSEFFEDSF